MARPTNGYYIGEDRIPSVTTILSRFKESGGLVHWAWDLGKKGLDYRDFRDSAASAGTIAHEMIRAAVFGKQYTPPADVTEEVLRKAKVGFDAFEVWWSRSRLKIVAAEQSMVSEQYRYGGTLDAICESDTGLCVVDFKTSTGRYPEYIVQLAAYRQLANETHDLCRDNPVKGCDLLWLDKETATFGGFGYPESVMDSAFEAFVYLRKLYDKDKELRRLV